MSDKNDSGDGVEVTLEGGGLTFSRKITVETALKVMAVAVGASVQADSATPPPNPNNNGGGDGSVQPPRIDLEVSVGEYITQHDARRNVEKIAAIAMWLKKGGQERFTSENIKSEFPNAGEKVPGNFSRDFRWAKTANWVAVDKDDKTLHYITNTGIKAVDANFSGDVKKASKVKVGTKKTSKASKASGSKP